MKHMSKTSFKQGSTVWHRDTSKYPFSMKVSSTSGNLVSCYYSDENHAGMFHKSELTKKPSKVKKKML